MLRNADSIYVPPRGEGESLAEEDPEEEGDEEAPILHTEGDQGEDHKLKKYMNMKA